MRKSSKIFLIILITIWVVVFGVYVIYKKYQKPPQDVTRLEVYNKMMDEMVMPSGIFELKRSYNGDNNLRDFYKSIKRYGEYTREISSYLDSKIENENDTIKNTLKNDFNVSNAEDVIEYYRGLNIENVYYATIDTETMKSTSKYLKFKMTIEYNDGEKKVPYEVKLSNESNSNNFVEYTLSK